MVPITRGVHVPQAMIIVLPVNIHVTNWLPIYGNGVFIQQPKKVNSYPQLGGEPPRRLPNGGFLGRGSLDRNPHGGLPPNPRVGFYGWQALDPRIFMPPWYQLVQVQYEPTNKLQYPTYANNIDPNAHIRVFKKTSKANGKTIEADIINLFGFTLQNNIVKWGENFV